jgi:DNA integrity scanning protein DisA with diadenylate cyclase activity
MHPSFPTDMRSGSHAIDFIIPKFTGNNLYNLAILVHDFNYTRNRDGGHYLSRLLSDQLLREMARVSGELNVLQRALMYRAVRMFGGSAYEEENTGAYEGAGWLMEFRW